MTASKFSFLRLFAVSLAFLFLISPLRAQDNFQDTVDQLKSPNPGIRRQAIERLSRMNSKPASDAVLSMLDNTDEGVRYAAIRAVGFYKDSRAVEPLLGFLDDSDSPMNQNIVWALGEIGDARAVEPLLRLVDKGNPSFKVTLAYALSGLNDVRAFEPLYRLLMENDGGSNFANAIIRLGSVTVEPLCRKVEQAGDQNRYVVVGILAAIADERAIPTLVWLIENHQGSLPTDQLARKIGTPAVDALLGVLSNQNPSARMYSVSALSQIKDERSVKALLSMLGDKYPGVRLKAVEGLANFSEENIGQELVSMLGDENQEVRLKTIEVLSKLNTKNIEQVLNETIGNPKLQFEVALIWGRKRDVRALPYLIEALKGKDLGKANEASWALLLIGKPAIDDLIAILLDKNKEYPEREIIYWREEARRERKLPSPILRCGTGYHPPIIDPRRRAAALLGQIGDKRAVEPLRLVLKDKSPGLRENAATALNMLGHTQP